MKILFLDHGQNLELARLLGKAGNTVLYHVSAQDKHSRHDVSLMGRGFKELTKIDSYLNIMHTVDMVCAPDCHDGEEVNYFLQQGMQVWGASSAATRLELDRWYAAKEENRQGLPTSGLVHIVGVPALIKFLQEPTAKGAYVKCSGFREVETFKHEDWISTQEQFIAPLLSAYGADEELEFVLTNPIDPAVEVGADNIVLNGQVTNITPYGYEDKDTSYVGVLSSRLPVCLQVINTAIIPHFLGRNTFWSTEVRVTPNRNGYPIDMTVRAAHPPIAGMMVGIRNLVDVVTRGVQPVVWPNANYIAVLIGESVWATNHPTEIKFPAKINPCVKFAKAQNRGGRIFTVPSTSYVVQVVGVGPTAELATNLCRRHAEQVTGKDLTFNFASFDKLLNETIPQGRKYGIEF